MNGSPMNLDQNPFEAILAKQAAQPAPQPQVDANGQPIVPEELQPGKTGDNTKPLLMAIQALHNYIAASTDQGTIQLVRNLISALTQLVARDQKMSEQAKQQMAQQGAPAAAQPAQPAAQPAPAPAQ